MAVGAAYPGETFPQVAAFQVGGHDIPDHPPGIAIARHTTFNEMSSNS